MLLPGHVIIPLTMVYHFSTKFGGRKLLLLSTLIFSILPDIDLFFVKNLVDHHQTWTHTPFFWLLIMISIFILGKLLRKNTLGVFALGIGYGSFSHLILDTFGMSLGIAWFAPISWKEYSFLPLQPEYASSNWFDHYVQSPAFWIEVIAVFLCLLFLVWKRRTDTFFS